MATSRTGTSTWKHTRKRALHVAQANGVTHGKGRDPCKHHAG